ncbi:transcription termination/antitermination protein NusG [Patescibacteria group bacterium]|nr:transcription termination/antitermination protein NusG [Patescibacteria group bacterium]
MKNQTDKPQPSKKNENPLESGFNWYVVHTYSGHEDKVKHNLEKHLRSFGMGNMVKEILVPTQDKIEFRGGEKKQIKERLYPGYVLILMKITDTTWSIIKRTPGVTGLVGRGNKPTPLSPSEIQNIKKTTQSKALIYKTKFSEGEAVKVTGGAFTDFVGTVKEINEEQGKMSVLVSIFGRETPVEIDLSQASKM